MTTPCDARSTEDNSLRNVAPQHACRWIVAIYVKVARIHRTGDLGYYHSFTYLPRTQEDYGLPVVDSAFYNMLYCPG